MRIHTHTSNYRSQMDDYKLYAELWFCRARLRRAQPRRRPPPRTSIAPLWYGGSASAPPSDRMKQKTTKITNAFMRETELNDTTSRDMRHQHRNETQRKNLQNPKASAHELHYHAKFRAVGGCGFAARRCLIAYCNPLQNVQGGHHQTECMIFTARYLNSLIVTLYTYHTCMLWVELYRIHWHMVRGLYNLLNFQVSLSLSPLQIGWFRKQVQTMPQERAQSFKQTPAIILLKCADAARCASFR